MDQPRPLHLPPLRHSMTREEFDAKYRLLQQVTQGDVKTFYAQASTGTMIMVHFLEGDSEQNQALLARMERLEPEDREQIVKIADLEGSTVVVSRFIMDFHSLPHWLESRVQATMSSSPPVPAPVPPSEEPPTQSEPSSDLSLTQILRGVESPESAPSSRPPTPGSAAREEMSHSEPAQRAAIEEDKKASPLPAPAHPADLPRASPEELSLTQILQAASPPPESTRPEAPPQLHSPDSAHDPIGESETPPSVSRSEHDAGQSESPAESPRSTAAPPPDQDLSLTQILKAAAPPPAAGRSSAPQGASAPPPTSTEGSADPSPPASRAVRSPNLSADEPSLTQILQAAKIPGHAAPPPLAPDANPFAQVPRPPAPGQRAQADDLSLTQVFQAMNTPAENARPPQRQAAQAEPKHAPEPQEESELSLTQVLKSVNAPAPAPKPAPSVAPADPPPATPSPAPAESPPVAPAAAPQPAVTTAFTAPAGEKQIPLRTALLAGLGIVLLAVLALLVTIALL